jgi:hypothetical protein
MIFSKDAVVREIGVMEEVRSLTQFGVFLDLCAHPRLLSNEPEWLCWK